MNINIKDDQEANIEQYFDETHKFISKALKVKGKILEHLRSRKTIVYKMRPKKKTRKKQGHRQNLTRVLIEEININ